MLSPRLTRIVASATSYASRTRGKSVDLVHFTLALVEESDIQRRMREFGVNYLDVRSNLLAEVEARVPCPDTPQSLSMSPLALLTIERAYRKKGCSVADAANLLKPALSSGKIRCIGATTHKEYEKYFDADQAMARRFQSIVVPEPSKAEAIDILSKMAPIYADHHGVTFADGVHEMIVDLSIRFIIDRQLPDKALDIIDETGSVAAARGMPEVTKALVHEIVGRMSGLSTKGDASVSSAFEAKLSARLKGQEAACVKIARAVARPAAGLNRDGRARASMLFAGPDRCGKRFAAEVVAEIQAAPVHRIDMAGFTESHSISRLLGSPPGYVGFDNGGQLTGPVRRTPSCTLILDRIDLAHPNIVTVITQAIETGSVTDSAGKNVNFAGVFFIMTAVEGERPNGIGFVSKAADDRAFNGTLDKDLIEAVDSFVRFDKLGHETLATIAESQITDLKKRLNGQSIAVHFDDGIAQLIAEAAVVDDGSGKAVERAFRRMIEEQVLDACPRSDSNVYVRHSDGNIDVQILAGEEMAA